MNIFIAKSKTREGPYSLDQLKELIQQNKVSMSDKVYYEGCSDWTRITDLPELVRMLLPPLPGEDSQALPPPTPSHTVQPATTNPPKRSAIPRENPRPGVSAPIPTGGISAVRPIPSNDPAASQVDNRFWTKPKTLAGWFGLILATTPFWGLAILFVCLGRWSYLAWEVGAILGIIILGWLANDWAGPRLITFAGRHYQITGILTFVVGGLLTLVACLLAVVAWGFYDETKGIHGGIMVPATGSVVTFGAGFRCMKLGWAGISARKRP